MTVAIFDVGSPAYQATASVGTTATLVWSGTAASLAAISPAVTLRDITVINTGANPIFVGGTSVTYATGMYVAPGAQLTVQGWSVTSNTVLHDVYAIVYGLGLTSSCAAGLATLASVV